MKTRFKSAFAQFKSTPLFWAMISSWTLFSFTLLMIPLVYNSISLTTTSISILITILPSLTMAAGTISGVLAAHNNTPSLTALIQFPRPLIVLALIYWLQSAIPVVFMLLFSAMGWNENYNYVVNLLIIIAMFYLTPLATIMITKSNMTTLELIKQSCKITASNFFPLLATNSLIFLLVLIGGAFLGVGLLFTLPLAWLIIANHVQTICAKSE